MHFFVLQVYNSNDYNMNWLYYNCLKMALKQERVHFVFRPKQSMYFRIFFYTGSGFQTLSGSPTPKFWSSTALLLE